MFFLIKLKRELLMHPTTFGPKLQEEIQRRLRKEVEGSVDGRYGFIITIVSTDPIPLGQIQEGSNESKKKKIYQL